MPKRDVDHINEELNRILELSGLLNEISVDTKTRKPIGLEPIVDDASLNNLGRIISTISSRMGYSSGVDSVARDGKLYLYNFNSALSKFYDTPKTTVYNVHGIITPGYVRLVGDVVVTDRSNNTIDSSEFKSTEKDVRECMIGAAKQILDRLNAIG